MKTTFDIPDELVQRAEEAASIRGKSLDELVTEALRARVDTESARSGETVGWRRVYGCARPEEVEPIDVAINLAFE